MGFMDFAGEMAGKLSAMAKDANNLKSEYEHMSDIELIREYENLKKKTGNTLERQRFFAVGLVLKDRGIGYK